MNDKIYVKSMVDGVIGINLPDLHLKKEWPRKVAMGMEFWSWIICHPANSEDCHSW